MTNTDKFVKKIRLLLNKWNVVVYNFSRFFFFSFTHSNFLKVYSSLVYT